MVATDAELLSTSPRGDALAWMDRCDKAAVSGEVRCDVGVAADDKLQLVGRRARYRDGLRWSPEGHLGVLFDVDPSSGEGEFRTWSADRGVEFVAEAVTSFDFAPGRLVYISGGVGFIRSKGSSVTVRAPVPLRSIVANAALEPPQVVALSLGTRGELFEVEGDGNARQISSNVSEFGFTPSGRMAIALTKLDAGRMLKVIPLGRQGGERILGHGVSSRAQPTRSDAVAFVADSEEGSALYVADLNAVSVQMVARDAARFAWAAQAPVLAWVAGRRRVLGAIQMGQAPLNVSEDVIDFELSENGAAVAFRKTLQDPGAHNRLYVAQLTRDRSSVAIDDDVRPGFAITPDGTGVVFRAICERELCELLGPPALGVEGFRFAPPYRTRSRDPKSFQRLKGIARWFKMDGRTGRVLAVGDVNDLHAVWQRQRSYIDRDVDLDSVIFLPPDAKRVAYTKRGQGYAGVYVADLEGD